MAISYFGIRHHGPGSAANLRRALEELRPDIILLEGPVEAEPLLKWTDDIDMQPPVAILAYEISNLSNSLFYPFAEFSPEWQAIRYAREKSIPVRLMDLPLVHKMAMSKKSLDEKEQNISLNDNSVDDPFARLSVHSGFEDAETWWEHIFENRKNAEGVFEAVEEAVTALRGDSLIPEEQMERCREAWMRKCIRETKNEMFSEVAVVCGAWHVPAIRMERKQKDDNEILKALPKVKVECTWIPWSYRRLSFESGYGAGIVSPGWYHHLWNNKDPEGLFWLTEVAHLFRENGQDISSAHIIEAVRMSNALASLRGLSLPGLREHNEAIISTMCMGEELRLALIRDQMIISPRLGTIPPESPRPPLLLDITASQKQLRIVVSESPKELILDLREERDLQKSVFLHRLKVIGVSWGYTHYIGSRGTFKEAWTLQWDPQFNIEIIDKGIYGNTLEEACNNFLRQEVQTQKSITVLSSTLDEVLKADLGDAASVLMRRIENLSAIAADIQQIMSVLPPLIRIYRYGSVRQYDESMLMHLLDALISRVCIGLRQALVSIDEELSIQMLELMSELDSAMQIIDQEDWNRSWLKTVSEIADNDGVAKLNAGYACRIMYDKRLHSAEESAIRLSRALSRSVDYASAAGWLEGFLKGSGSVLLVDTTLWTVIHEWLGQLEEEHFVFVLPLLRRTFSRFESAERRKIGELARNGPAGRIGIKVNNVDQIVAEESLDIVMELLGMINGR